MYTVLLVDDEPWALKGIVQSFEWSKMGFHVVGVVSSPVKALEIMENTPPDVVFSDIRMPVMSGLELLKAAREKGLDTDFVIISGFAEFEYAREAMNHGAFYYLLKPIDLEEAAALLSNLRNHLMKKEMVKRIPESSAVSENQPKIDIAGLSVSGEFKELLTYVTENYRNEHSLAELSQRFHISTTYICDLFKKVTQKTLSRYLTDLRMEKACALLKNTDMSIEQIAAEVGYEDHFYFFKLFKRHFNTTPAKFRRG